jgi:hypothetical protein
MKKLSEDDINRVETYTLLLMLSWTYMKTFSTYCVVIQNFTQESKTTYKTPSKRHLRLVGSTLSVNSYNFIIKL